MGVSNKIKRGISEILRYMPGKVPVKTPVLYGELLKGRTALITGGTSGIGYEIARAYLRNGASVIITGRNEEKLILKTNDLKKEFPDATVLCKKMDNNNILAIKEQFQIIISNLQEKKIDILVNNAGVLNKTQFGSVDERDYDVVMATDLKGPYFLSEIVGGYMRENGVTGNILNICSSSSIRPATTSYQLAKWGIRGFTKGLARELIGFNIVVNGLAPGPTATEMLLYDDNINRPSSPNGRFATPEEMANLAVILVSDIGKTIVGDTVFATGGSGLLTYDDWD